MKIKCTECKYRIFLDAEEEYDYCTAFDKILLKEKDNEPQPLKECMELLGE